MKRTLLMLAALCTAPAFAQSLVPVINNADIDSSGSRYQGNLSVNQAAGDKQQQVNARLQALRGALRGRLLMPTDEGYDAFVAARDVGQKLFACVALF